MDKKEKVVCCAIKYIPITRYFSTKIKHEDKYRICLCISYENAYIAEAHTESIKGFMTNKNRFVDAKEAEIIAGLAGQIWIDNGKHNLSSIQFEKSLKTMKESGLDSIKIRFPSSDGYYFIDHIIGNGLKPEDLY